MCTIDSNDRILKVHSHSMSEDSIWAALEWLRFLKSWRVSVAPQYLITFPPAIQKPQWRTREAQIEPQLIECESERAFRIRA